MQTKLRSWIESGTGTVLGMTYAIPLNYVMVTQIDWTNRWWKYAVINTVIFMIVGTLFKFCIRRLFEWWDRVDPPGDPYENDNIIG